MGYHSVDRQYERRRRRVDSTRANRRHGIWMFNNGLQGRADGGGGAGGGGGGGRGRGGGGRLNRLESWLQPRYGGATGLSRMRNRVAARARTDLRRARTVGRGAQAVGDGLGTAAGGGRRAVEGAVHGGQRAGSATRRAWKRSADGRRAVLDQLLRRGRS